MAINCAQTPVVRNLDPPGGSLNLNPLQVQPPGQSAWSLWNLWSRWNLWRRQLVQTPELSSLRSAPPTPAHHPSLTEVRPARLFDLKNQLLPQIAFLRLELSPQPKVISTPPPHTNVVTSTNTDVDNATNNNFSTICLVLARVINPLSA